MAKGEDVPKIVRSCAGGADGKIDFRRNDGRKFFYQNTDIIIGTIMCLIHFSAVPGKNALKQKDSVFVCIYDRGDVIHVAGNLLDGRRFALKCFSVPVV